jgi:hypothetical protein
MIKIENIPACGRQELLIKGGVKVLPCTILGSGPALSNRVHRER